MSNLKVSDSALTIDQLMNDTNTWLINEDGDGDEEEDDLNDLCGKLDEENENNSDPNEHHENSCLAIVKFMILTLLWMKLISKRLFIRIVMIDKFWRMCRVLRPKKWQKKPQFSGLVNSPSPQFDNVGVILLQEEQAA